MAASRDRAGALNLSWQKQQKLKAMERELEKA